MAKIATAVLEIKTDTSQAITGLDQFEKRGAVIGKSFKNVSRDLESFGASLGTTGGLLATFGAGLSVGAAVAFGKALVADADALVKLSDKTGVTLQGLQKFQIAGDEAGNTVDDLTAAITKMEDKLASGDSSALSALNKLGIPFQDIKNLSPENQFLAISDAIRQIKDPAQQVAIAIDLFGKAGANVLPTLKRGFDDLKDSAVGMSDETVRALDKAGDELSKWTRLTEGFAAEAIVDFGHKASDAFRGISHDAGNLRREMENFADDLKRLTDKIPTSGLPAAAPLQVSTSDAEAFKRASQEIEAALSKQREAAKKAAEEHARLVDKLHDVERAGYQDSVALRIMAGDLENVGTKTDDIERLKKGFDDLDASMRSAAQSIHEISLKWPSDLAELSENLGGNVIDSMLTAPVISQLPKITSSLGDARRMIDTTKQSLSALSQAFSELAQVSDGSMGIMLRSIGSMIAGVNLGITAFQGLTRNAKELGGAVQMTAANVAGMVSGIGAMVSIGTTLQGVIQSFLPDDFSTRWTKGIQLVAQAFAGLGRTATEAFQKITTSYLASGRTLEQMRADLQALASAAKDGAAAVNDVLARIFKAIDEGQKVIDAQHASGARSNTELQAAADLARQAFDKARDSGDFNQENLDKLYVAYQQALADAGSAAAKSWLEAHNAIADSAKTVNVALDEMKSKWKTLDDQISQEAPEPDMGSIEKDMRKQRDDIAAQIKAAEDAAQQQADAAGQAATDSAETFKHTTDDWAKYAERRTGDLATTTAEQFDGAAASMREGFISAADEAAAGIASQFSNLSFTIPIHFATDGIPSAPRPPLVPLAVGGYLNVTRPTGFVAGEAGSEDVVAGGAGRNLAKDVASALGPFLSDRGGTNAPIYITVKTMLDGREAASSVHRAWDRNPDGLRTEAQEILGVR